MKNRFVDKNEKNQTIDTVSLSGLQSQPEQLIGRFPQPNEPNVSNDHGQPIHNGFPTAITTPTLSGGIAWPASKVIIMDNGQPIGEASVDENGYWTFKIDAPLAEGQHVFTIIAVSTTGIASEESAPYIVFVDNSVQPTIAVVIDDQNNQQNGVTADNTPTLKGTGEPGMVLDIYANGKKIGEAPVDENGNWTFTPDEPLKNDYYGFSAKNTNDTGYPTFESKAYGLMVEAPDTGAPGKPGDGGTGGVFAILDDHGRPVAEGAQLNDSTPTLQGAGMPPGGSVIIKVNGQVIGEAPVDANGYWSYTPKQPLAQGTNTFSIIAVSPTGIHSEESEPFSVRIEASAPPTHQPEIPPTITEILDDGNNQQTPQHGISADSTPTLKGIAQPGASVEIYANGKKIGQALVGEDGTWTFTPDQALSNGYYNFTVNEAGNPGLQSPPYPLMIHAPDTTAPGKPGDGGTGGVFEILDDHGRPVAEGAQTEDTTPTLRGSGMEPGSSVIVYHNGIPIGQAHVDAYGKWAFTPNQPLTLGTNTFTLLAISPTGIAGEMSDPYSVQIASEGSLPPADGSAPAAIATIDNMSKDSGADHQDFITRDGSAGRLIRGSMTEPLAEGEKVQVSVDGGRTWQDAVLNNDGSWSFVDQNRHHESWEIQARVIDSVTQRTGTKSSQSVELNQSVPTAPKAIEVSTDTVTVKFDGDQLSEGDSISLSIGDQRIDYLLTAEDIAAGTAAINVPLELQPLDVSSVSAAIVDAAGYNSEYISKGDVVYENFSSVTDTKTYIAGKTLALDSMQIKVLHGATRIHQRIDVEDEGEGLRLHFGLASSLGSFNDKLEISPTHPCSKMTFTTSDLENPASYEFYDTQGNLLAKLDFDGNKDGYSVSYTAPEGVQIGKVIATTNELGYLDNFEFGGPDQLTWQDAPGEQTISGEATGTYYGSQGNDSFLLENPEAFANSANGSIHGGEGIDTLKLTGQNQILDLTALGKNISSIEVIDLTGSGDNILKLSLDNVLNNGATNLFYDSDATQMLVKGDEGDIVDLRGLSGTDSGSWAVLGQVSVGGVAYDVYRHSALDAELLVEQGVSTNLSM